MAFPIRDMMSWDEDGMETLVFQQTFEEQDLA
jgi:hypothetical protein